MQTVTRGEDEQEPYGWSYVLPSVLSQASLEAGLVDVLQQMLRAVVADNSQKLTELLQHAGRSFGPVFDINCQFFQFSFYDDPYQGNLLMFAAARNAAHCVQLLLSPPSNISPVLCPTNVNSACARTGYTALMMAATLGFAAVVKLLLQAPGIDANRCDTCAADIGGTVGWTPLINAARQGHVETVRTFVEQAQAVNLQINYAAEYQGETALIAACSELSAPWTQNHKDGLDVVHLLLSVNGIDLSRPNKHGQTAVDIARAWVAANASPHAQQLLAALESQLVGAPEAVRS